MAVPKVGPPQVATKQKTPDQIRASNNSSLKVLKQAGQISDAEYAFLDKLINVDGYAYDGIVSAYVTFRNAYRKETPDATDAEIQKAFVAQLDTLVTQGTIKKVPQKEVGGPAIVPGPGGATGSSVASDLSPTEQKAKGIIKDEKVFQDFQTAYRALSPGQQQAVTQFLNSAEGLDAKTILKACEIIANLKDDKLQLAIAYLTQFGNMYSATVNLQILEKIESGEITSALQAMEEAGKLASPPTQ
jgi:hypothetical protein